MSLTYSVILLDQVTVTDDVDREPDRIDILIQDVIAVADLVLTPRQIAITSVTPNRLRAGDVFTIKGQGFATSIASNRVTINGFSCTISAAAEDELTATAPFLLQFTENGVGTLEAESPPFSTLKGRAQVWTKWSTVVEEADEELPLQGAELKETVGEERPRVAEAGDFNKLLTLVDHAQLGGAEGQPGGFKSRDSVGLVTTPRRNNPGGPVNPQDNTTPRGGESLVVDPSQPGLTVFGWQLDDTLAFGGQFLGFQFGLAYLRANGTPLAGLNLVETEQVVMLAGVIDLAWYLVTSPGGDTITATEVYVNGVLGFAGGGPGGNNTVARLRMSIPVVRGDRVELRVGKTGATANVQIVGGLRVRYD
jgi:hypothetical protein